MHLLPEISVIKFQKGKYLVSVIYPNHPLIFSYYRYGNRAHIVILFVIGSSKYKLVFFQKRQTSEKQPDLFACSAIFKCEK